MEKTKVKLLAIQMNSVIANVEKNIQKARKLLEENLSIRSADFVFLPEVWTCGWDCKSFKDSADVLENSCAIKMLTDVAKTYNVNIVGGSFIEKKANNIYANTCPVINRKGELVCTYEKNHLYSYYGCNEGGYITPGDKPVVVEIEGVKLGVSICYDIRFPELYRAYRKAGADILVNMAAWGAEKKIPWDVMTTARAVENQTYFVALTQTGALNNGNYNLGHSMIIDYKGDILSEVNNDEAGFYAEINLESMYEFRNKCLILDDIKNSYEVQIR